VWPLRRGESPELEQLARNVVFMKPNFSYTIKDITSVGLYKLNRVEP
jgi:hypothetical protein